MNSSLCGRLLSMLLDKHVTALTAYYGTVMFYFFILLRVSLCKYYSTGISMSDTTMS